MSWTEGPLLVSYGMLWLLSILEAVAIFALYHHFGEMYLNSREGRENQGPPVGSQIKGIDVVGVSGQLLTLPQLQRPHLLLFLATDCRICRALVPELTNLTRSFDYRITLLCSGDAQQVAAWAELMGSDIGVVSDTDRHLATTYEVGLTPFLLGVDQRGILRLKGIVNHLGTIEDFVTALLARPQARELQEVGL